MVAKKYKKNKTNNFKNMVKENLIPKTETVYEIKSEIPSYEEFLKTYEKDGKVTESYEHEINAYGDLGKGYGPCSDYRCYGSNRCLDGEYFYPLRVPCPAIVCRGKGGSPISWVHDNPGCGYNTDKISNKARIRCPDCFNTSHMKYHSFKCSLHKDKHEKTSSTSFADALFVAFHNDEISSDVFTDLLAELKRNAW
jgi:hypothetical protein